MFIIWGVLHGAGLVVHRAWSSAGLKMYKPMAWLVTFLYVHIAWVFFRAHSLSDAMNVIGSMFNFSSMTKFTLLDAPIENLSMIGIWADRFSELMPPGIVGYSIQFAAISCAFAIISFKNSIEIVMTERQATLKVSLIALISAMALYMTLHTTSAVFLYFNF